MQKDSILRLGDHIDCVPIIHGRAIFAQEVRRLFLSERYQCIAVELPLSLGPVVVEAVGHLPLVTAVVYREQDEKHCYVPVEPGEAIIEALRLANEERILIEFVDMEIDNFPTTMPVLPDEYAIAKVGLEKYYRNVLPVLPQSKARGLQDRREKWMAAKLKQLDKRFSKILFVCGMAHLEGIRRHMAQPRLRLARQETPDYQPKIYTVHSDSLFLLMGEIPYLTFLYEKSRYTMNIEDYDKTDGIKELLLETRKEFCRDFPEEKERLSPGALQILLKYLRNLSLIQGKLTPAMYDLIVAAQGVGGGGFGAKLVEMAKFYPYQDPLAPFPTLRMGINTGWLEPQGETPMKNRLPGPPFSLEKIRLERYNPPQKKKKWKRNWGSFGECSWPEEDIKIENFTDYVRKRALGLLGEDQAKVEKFASSIKDGIDIRETIRKWHTGDIFVKEMPPVRGEVGAVIFIFDDNAEKYPWRSTWLAEHENESTLAFYASNYSEDMVGPGIGKAYYGGALFIFPPITISDIWRDRKFSTTQRPAAKLVAAGIHYSNSKYVAYVAQKKPDLEMRKLARQAKKHLIYLPLSGFSAYTLRKLRKFHVLQGHHIRSYARKYIR